MAVGIGAAFQQHHGNVQGICRPENGADITGILDAVQQQHAGTGNKGFLFRQTAQEQGALGGLHGRNGLHHILGHAHHPDMCRNIHLHTVG